MRYVLVLAMAAGSAGAQAFEVATVKPAAPVTGHDQYHMTMRTDPGNVIMTNASIADLIRAAYRVQFYQIAGPDWIATEKFDVMAKLPADAGIEKLPEMLQALLAERFHLAVRRDVKEQNVLALVAAKGGAKLQESGGGAAAWSRTTGADGSLHIDTRHMTVGAVADLLGSFLGRPVSDQTGVQGVYDVPLDFSTADVTTGTRTSGVFAPDAVAGDEAGSSVAASLRLVGLKLETRRLPLERIVIERVERAPMEN